MNNYDIVILSAEDLLMAFGPMYIGQHLINHGYRVKTLHFITKFSDNQVNELIDKFITSHCKLIGVSMTFVSTAMVYDRLIQVLNKIREKFPNIPILFGGPSQFNVSNVLPNSFEVLGQNKENEIIDIVNRICGKIKRIPFDFKNHKVDYNAFFPSTPPKGIPMFIEVSKGCIFDCAFCSFQLRKTKSQLKDKEQIKLEIENYYSKFNNDQIMIICNTFNDSVDKIELMYEVANELSFKPRFWVMTRFDLLVKQVESSNVVLQFYKEFVRYALLGIETIKPQTLKRIQKSPDVNKLKAILSKIKSECIDTLVLGTFIFGLPEETEKDFDETINWINSSNLFDHVSFSPLGLKKYDINSPNAEYSNMDIYPEKYGYHIFNDGEWERSDGYTKRDAIKYFESVNQKLDPKYHLKSGSNKIIFMASRNKNLPESDESFNAEFAYFLNEYFVFLINT